MGSSGEVDGQRSGEEGCGEHEAQEQRCDAGIEEEPARAVEEKKAQVTPAIAPGAEVGRAVAAVGRERRRDFGHTQTGEG